MTYALILIKGKADKRKPTLDTILSMKNSSESDATFDVTIEKVFMSFGWSDYVILVKAENIEQITFAIHTLRKKLSEHEDYIETSTIVCTTPEELREKRREWADFT